VIVRSGAVGGVAGGETDPALTEIDRFGRFWRSPSCLSDLEFYVSSEGLNLSGDGTMRRQTLFATAVAAVSVLFSAPAFAQERVQVQFAPGNFGTMVTGEVTGDGYVDYLLGASAGQEMFVELVVTGSTGSGVVYFNILPPGSDGVAIYNGSIDGTTTTVTLPENGDYAIRVYQMGNDRDTGARAEFRIDLSIQ
jgi:hypothetical protein